MNRKENLYAEITLKKKLNFIANKKMNIIATLAFLSTLIIICKLKRLAAKI